MLTNNQLIDCFFYIISYGAPSISILVSLGHELKKREFSTQNYMHTHRLLRVLVLLKSYFKDPIFIEDDEEWKAHSMGLFEVFKDLYLERISPLIEAQFQEYLKPSFNPKLYLTNIGFICFLNGVFQEPQNLVYLIESSEKVIQYHSLWFSFFRKQNEGDNDQNLLASATDEPKSLGIF